MSAPPPEPTQDQIDDFLATVRLPLVTDAARRSHALLAAAHGGPFGLFASGHLLAEGSSWAGLWWMVLQIGFLGGLLVLVVWRRRLGHRIPAEDRRREFVGVIASGVLALALVTWAQLGGAPTVDPLAAVGAGLLTAAPCVVAARRIAPEIFSGHR